MIYSRNDGASGSGGGAAARLRWIAYFIAYIYYETGLVFMR